MKLHYAIVCVSLALSIVSLHIAPSDQRQVVIYEVIESEQLFPCQKLLNSTNTIGCEGPLSPQAGILLFNITEENVELLDNRSTYYPIIPVFYSWDYNLTSILIKLNQWKHKIAGVIVVNKNSSEIPSDQHPRSDDVSCPNELVFGNQSNCYKWINSPDDKIGSFFRHWLFPIFYLEDPLIIEIIENCTAKRNSDIFKQLRSSNNFQINDFLNLEPFCGAELYNPNYASNGISATRCLMQYDRAISLEKVSYCDNIYVTNQWAPLIPMNMNVTYEDRSILIVAVRIDSLTLFAGKAPAADSVYSALITLFSIAQTLTKNRNLFENTTRQVIFTFYNGESLDYIGSSYQVTFLNKQNGTPNMGQIGYVLELNQLANHANEDDDDDSTFWLYSKMENSSYLSPLMLKWALSTPNVTLRKVNSSLPYPPSSVYSFANSTHIETAVITNHEGHFTNLYYHSLFDQAFNVLSSQKQINSSSSYNLGAHLAKIATIISRSIAEFLNETTDAHNISADVDFIDQLIECIFVNQSCSLLDQIQKPGYYNQSDFQNTGIFAPNKDLQQLILDLMAHLTGDIVSCPDGNFTEAFAYRTQYEANDTKMCLRYQVFEEYGASPYFTSRLSAAQSGHLSQWVISHHRPSWASPKLRIFLLPSRTYEFILLAIGIAFFMCSITFACCCFSRI